MTTQMVGIGMNFAAAADHEADIEATLVAASQLGMVDGDLRVLAVLTTWLGIHHGHVNADRLIRMVHAEWAPRVRAYWAAIALWLAADRRLHRLATGYSGERVDLLEVGTDFQILRHGEDLRFAGSPVRVAAGALRDRPADVVPPAALVQRHLGYRNRTQMGPTWRADVWTALQRQPSLTPAEAARAVGCAFATAWQVVADFQLLQGAAQGAEPPSARL